MNDFWNQKYNTQDYIYGNEPNEFLKQQLLKLKPGSLLLPAEGEGRNAVFAAKNGWQVTAFDSSSIGLQKALNLAKKNKVTITYLLQGYEDTDFAENSFDAIGLIYTHMPSTMRKIMHKNYIKWLKPGGKIILEAFSKEQLKYNSGGPKDIDMIFSIEELSDDFLEISDNNVSLHSVELNEGIGHFGTASVVRLFGVK